MAQFDADHLSTFEMNADGSRVSTGTSGSVGDVELIDIQRHKANRAAGLGIVTMKDGCPWRRYNGEVRRTYSENATNFVYRFEQNALLRAGSHFPNR